MNYKRKKPRTQPGGCYCKYEKLHKIPKAKDLELPESPVRKRKKSTRKWCKGKVGVEHQWEWVFPKGGGYVPWPHPSTGEIPEYVYQVLTCQNCGKQKHSRRFHTVCQTAHTSKVYWWRWSNDQPTTCPLDSQSS